MVEHLSWVQVLLPPVDRGPGHLDPMVTTMSASTYIKSYHLAL